jgi:predicted ester cyclase
LKPKNRRPEVPTAGTPQPKRTRPWCATTSKRGWNRHTIEAAEELLSPDYLNHAASAEEYRHGIAGVKHSLKWLFCVFADHRLDIEDAAARMGTRWRRYGVYVQRHAHEGELFGIPPVGERFAVQQSRWFRVADGKVAEHWAVRDDLGMMRQLGVMPS